MLRKHDNVQLLFAPGLFTGKGWVTLQIGVRTLVRFSKLHKTEWADYAARQQEHPVRLTEVKNRMYWWFQDQFYSENEGLSGSAVYALIVTRQQRQAQRIDRAQQIVAMGTLPRSTPIREAIPDDVKHLVWTRDQGSCRNCGATVELQFDHIIPVSMGGSSSPDNLQVLCGPCNRQKGASITVHC